jgi:hypothetical protein
VLPWICLLARNLPKQNRLVTSEVTLIRPGDWLISVCAYGSAFQRDLDIGQRRARDRLGRRYDQAIFSLITNRPGKANMILAPPRGRRPWDFKDAAPIAARLGSWRHLLPPGRMPIAEKAIAAGLAGGPGHDTWLGAHRFAACRGNGALSVPECLSCHEKCWVSASLFTNCCQTQY